MKRYFLYALCISFAAIFFHGCTTDDNGGNPLCPELVQFTKDCYEEIIGRSPPDTYVEDWREGCSTSSDSEDCMRCAMEQSCDDFINNTEYVRNVICADRCDHEPG